MSRRKARPIVETRIRGKIGKNGDTVEDAEWALQRPEPGERQMPCPICGHPMPDLKGGKDTICPVCGFKDSCCY